MPIRRGLGIRTDPNSSTGGSEYDDLDPVPGGSTFDDEQGWIPDATDWLHATGGQFADGVESYNRNNQVGRSRVSTPEVPIQANPQLTGVAFPGYLPYVAKLLLPALGLEQRVGTAPAASVHTGSPLELGAADYLPKAFIVHMVRDGLNLKLAGAFPNRVQVTFPMDGPANGEVDFHGLAWQDDPAAPPTQTYGAVTRELMLRDAKAYFDGSVQSIPDLRAYGITITNNLEADWAAGRNRMLDDKDNILWLPYERRLGAGLSIVFSMGFGKPDTLKEVAASFRQLKKIEFECLGAALPSTSPAATEAFTVTQYASQFTQRGADALSAREVLRSSYEGGARFDSATGKSIEVELIDKTYQLHIAV